MKLASGVMPPSNVGRKPKPLNPELTEALFEALENAVPEAVETDEFETKLYPAFFGPDFSETAHVWKKDFQAQADGRKYANALKKRIKKTVRVNVYHNGNVDSAGKETDSTRYTWRLYIPVSEYTEEELTPAEEMENAIEDLAEAIGELEDDLLPEDAELTPEDFDSIDA